MDRLSIDKNANLIRQYGRSMGAGKLSELLAENTAKYILDWRMEDCRDHRTKTDVEYNYYTKRYNCPECWQALEKGPAR